MEDIRTYLTDDNDQRHIPEDERVEFSVSGAEDEVPFHIPRD